MNEQALLKRVMEARTAFGKTCKKYSGTVTLELMRRALQENDILVSPRDIFISGIPIEIDLLVPRGRARSRWGVLYRPEDVLAVMEVKTYGSFGKSAVDVIRGNFDNIRASAPDISCVYVTLAERKSYKWAVSTESLGYPAFTLFWHSGPVDDPDFKATGDWAKLLHYLRSLRKAAV